MATVPWMPPPEKDLSQAKRQYVEQVGSVLATNTYLWIAVFLLSATCLSLTVLTFKAYTSFRHLKPLVIRVDSVGRPEAVRYESFEYQPREPEIKYFLIDFVQRHYGRMRPTVRDNFARSLYFLDAKLADAQIEAHKKSKVVEALLSGAIEEVDIQVNNVSIEDLRKAPYRATVDFEKVYYSPSDRAETRREKYIANFVFVVKERVPNEMIPVNPLGLTITYFREDQAFQAVKP